MLPASWIFFLVSPVFVTLPLQAADINVSMQNIRELLEAKNLKILAARREEAAAVERGDSLNRSFYPTLEIYAGQEMFKTGQQATKNQPLFGIESRVNLYNGGRDQIHERMIELEQERRKARTRRLLAEEMEKASVLYWDSLFLLEHDRLLGEAMKVNQSNGRLAIRRIRGGVATEVDRVEFELKDRELARQRNVLVVQSKAVKQHLAVVLGMPDDKSLKLTDEFKHDHDLEGILKHSHADHDFWLREQEAESEQLQLRADAGDRANLPRLEAFAGYHQYTSPERDFDRAEDRAEPVVGVRLTVGLGALSSQKREIAALKLEADSARMQTTYRRKEYESEFEREVDELLMLHHQAHDAEESIKRAQQYYQMTLSEYERGVKNSPDVLNASEKVLDAKVQLLEIIRDFHIAKSHILAKSGKR